jgi:hypothetical protein
MPGWSNGMCSGFQVYEINFKLCSGSSGDMNHISGNICNCVQEQSWLLVMLVQKVHADSKEQQHGNVAVYFIINSGSPSINITDMIMSVD